MTQRNCKIGGAAALFLVLGFSAGCGGGSGTTQVSTPTTFTTIDGPGGGPTTFNGISSGGTVVGLTTNNGANANFLRDPDGTITPLNIGDPAAGMANGVNYQKSVVGVANNAAFLLANGKQSVQTPPNSTASIAFGINDSGVIVGQYTAAGGNLLGFVEENGNFTTIMPVASATVTNVQAINNKGTTVGFYSADGVHQHGFSYNIRSKQTTLLPDPSTARTVSTGLTLTQFLGVNDNNEAVGYYQTGNGSQFGFLYNLTTRAYTFLDAPLAVPVNGVQITQITGVSNAGVITGFFVDAQGAQHGFVASPPSGN